LHQKCSLSRAILKILWLETDDQRILAVLAVWDKLVSGCISLRTGKFTGNSADSVPLSSRAPCR